MRDYTSYTEDELVRLLRNDDEKAFTEIYNRFWEKLLGIGYYHLRDKQSAEDIVHEVMISLWARRRETDIQSLPAYLATAVKFAVFKAIARDKKRRNLLEAQGPQPDHTTATEGQLDALFLKEYLAGVVEELPEKAKLVFRYSRGHELSIAEIAKKMELSPKAVEYHMTKALRALKNSIQKIKLFFV